MIWLISILYTCLVLCIISIIFVESGKPLPNTTTIDIHLPVNKAESRILFDFYEGSLQAVTAVGACQEAVTSLMCLPPLF